MGADLYIRSLHDKQTEEWKPRFEKAVEERDKQELGTPAYEAAQEEVVRCYEQLTGSGYFRDPYNNWDVLWCYGLSWWNDVLPHLDNDHRLSVVEIERLLALLDERQDTFDDEMSECVSEDREYFENQAKALRAFLNQAIELKEPIDCSL